jgi:signal transduction histidine kinase/CheY-like chemotaxis protein/streptogramin lyase
LKGNRLPPRFDNLVATARRAVVALMLLIPLSAQVTRADAPPHRLPETPQFELFGPEDGLPSSTVYALAQDAKGYLWIGTADGLARYDGVGFKVFRHDPKDPHSLPSNVVQALHVDAQQRLWIACEGGGLSVLSDALSSQFSHYNETNLQNFSAPDVWAITSDVEGTLWFGGFGSGLHQWKPDSPTLHRRVHDETDENSLPDDNILSLSWDQKGALVVGTSSGMATLTNQTLSRLRQSESPAANFVIQLSTSPSLEGIHVGTRAGLRLLRSDGEIADVATSAGVQAITALMEVGDGTLWLGTRNGLFHRDLSNTWHHYRGSANRRRALSGNAINAVLEDHEGGIWIATLERGLSRLSPTWRNFSVFQTSTASFESAEPKGLAPAKDGGIWVVSLPAVLSHIDLRSGEVRSVLGEPGALPNDRPLSVLQTQDGAVWIGHRTGLIRFDERSGRFQTFNSSDSRPIPAGYVDQLVDAGDSFWLSAQGGGLQRRALDGNIMETITAGQAGLDSVDTEQLLRTVDDNLWWSGATGLRRRKPGSRNFEKPEGSPEGRIFGFDLQGEHLWLHRMEGLEHYRISGDTLQLLETVNERAGLPSVESGGVSVDKRGDVWLTTARGLYRYRPTRDNQAAELRVFSQRDGLPSPEFYKRPPLVLPDGRLVASTLEGVVAFDPMQLQSIATESTLQWDVISVLRATDRAVLIPTLQTPIHLHHSDTDLRIAVRLLSFADPSANRYRFRLQGVDAGWVETGNIPERSYPALPAGDYLLEVSAANADGQWTTPLQAQIHMAPAWWVSSPAKVLYALSLLLLGALLLRGWRARLAERHQLALAEQAKQLAEEASRAKGRFLSTLGHEIRTPMTGLLGMNELLLHSDLQPTQRQQAEAVRRSGQMMLRLLNESLDLARIDAGKLQIAPQATDLHQLLRDVAELQSAPAQRKGLRFELDIDASLPPWVSVDPLRLQQILLNLTGNAIKFTETGVVRLRAVAQAMQGDRVSLRFEVHDSGAGMDADTLARLFQPFEQAQGARTAQQFGGSGLGLLISRQLAEAMQGEVQATSTIGEGSTFSLSLPVDLATADQPVAPISIQTPTPATQSLLLVEDEADVAAAVGGLLRQMGHTVDHAEHALQALGLIAQRDYAQAVLDLDLPGIDGLTLAGMLRKQRPNMRLIALTARAEADTEQRALAAGFAVFLRKPMSLAQLRDAIAGGDPSS